MAASELEQYRRLYQWCGLSNKDFYGDRDVSKETASLFENLSVLAMRNTPFNNELPEQFLRALRGWRQGDTWSQTLFEDKERRAFFLSDFYDYLELMRWKKELQ